jgi:uncharacterized protein (TIGR02145 family)
MKLVLSFMLLFFQVLLYAQQPDKILIDQRDGQQYKTVKIGNQVWMAEDLRSKVGSPKVVNGNYYYDWDHAMEGSCPAGWFLPSDSDFDSLISILGSPNALKSKFGWKKNDNGKNNSLLNFAPNGYLTKNEGENKFKLTENGEIALFWTTLWVFTDAGGFTLISGADSAEYRFFDLSNSLLPCRCIKKFEARTTKEELKFVKNLKSTIHSRSDSFTDPRDNRTYKTVQIGNQVWMAENLKYVLPADKKPRRGESERFKYYFFGCLYSKDEVQAACPEGWHLASIAEWDSLESFLGEKAAMRMKSEIVVYNYLRPNPDPYNCYRLEGDTLSHTISLWDYNGNGDNSSGFDMVPGGYWEGKLVGVGNGAYFWTAEGKIKEYQYNDFGSGKIKEDDDDFKGVSCRCVKGKSIVKTMTPTVDSSSIKNTSVNNKSALNEKHSIHNKILILFLGLILVSISLILFILKK